MKRFLMVLVAALAALPLDAAAAGAAEAPVAGTRIRVTAPSLSGKRLVGTLVGLDETTLRLQREGKEPLVVPRASILKVEVSRRRSRNADGAGIGLLIGLGTAIAIGLATGDDCNAIVGDSFEARLSRAFCYDRGETALITGILTVPAGVVLGLVAAPGERWEASSPDRLRLAIAPARRGGVRASLAIRF
jgi:hypothetical protein